MALSDANCVVQRRVELPSAVVEVRHYDWAGPFEHVYHFDHPVLCCSASAVPRASRGRADTNDSHSPFTKLGRVIFRPRELPFHVRNDGGQQQLLFCALNDSQFPDEFRELGRDPDFIAQLGLNIEDARVQGALIRLFHEAINPGFGATTLSEALLLMGLVDLSRYFAQRRRSTDASRVSSLAPWQLRRVFERLADDSMPPPAVTELAALIGVSRRHLSRAFRASTGRTVAATVAETQLVRARQLLAGDAPLKEIAHRLGFADHSTFSSAFRRATGRAPSDYRREAQATVVQMPVHMNSGCNPNLS